MRLEYSCIYARLNSRDFLRDSLEIKYIDQFGQYWIGDAEVDMSIMYVI